MNRREALKGLVASLTGLPALSAVPPSGEAWRVRLQLPESGQPVWTGAVFDAQTGEDVSRWFPAKCAKRLLRSLHTGRPMRMTLFLRDARGHLFLDGPDGHIATKPVIVHVVETA